MVIELLSNQSSRAIGYGGPCPPVGRDRYSRKLYALDVALPALHFPDKAQLENAMHGHVLAQVQLTGLHGRLA